MSPLPLDSHSNPTGRYLIQGDTGKTGYHNLQVQCKMQMEAPLFKNYEEFPETEAEHLTERGVLLSVEP